MSYVISFSVSFTNKFFISLIFFIIKREWDWGEGGKIGRYREREEDIYPQFLLVLKIRTFMSVVVRGGRKLYGNVVASLLLNL